MKIGNLLAATLCIFAYNPIHVFAQESLVSSDSTVAQASFTSLIEQGVERLGTRDYQGAIQSASQAIQLNGQSGEAYAVRASAHRSLGNTDEAIEDYTTAIGLLPNGQNKAQTFYDRAIAHSDSLQVSQAISDLTSALEVVPSNASQLKAEIYYRRGYIRSENNQTIEAIDDFTKALEIDSNYLEAYAQRGLTTQRYLGDKVSATRDYIAAVSLNPEGFAESYWSRGEAHRVLGNLQAANSDYESAMELDSGFTRTFLSKFLISFSLLSESIESDFQQAIDADPDNWWTVIRFSDEATRYAKIVLSSSSSSEEMRVEASSLYSTAFNELGEALGRYPNKPLLYLTRGTVLLRTDQPVAALSDFSRALSLEPNYAVAYYLRGLAHSQLRNLNGAVADFDRAIQANPNFADAYLSRGSVRLQLEDQNGRSDIEHAIRLYDEIIQLNPTDADTYISLGDARYALGNGGSGASAYQEASRVSQQQGNNLSALRILSLIDAREELVVPAPLIENFGELSVGGPTLNDDSLYETYSFQGVREQRLIITLVSDEFDTYLKLIGPDGEEVARNDDVSESSNDSYISTSLVEDGTYTVWANAYDQTGSGRYSLSVLPGPADGFILQNSGTLNVDELVLTDGSAYDKYFFEGRRGQAVTVDMSSNDFDTYLVLLDPASEKIAENDDISASNRNSQITTILPSDGIYTIWANGYDSNEQGQYSITAR